MTTEQSLRDGRDAGATWRAVPPGRTLLWLALGIVALFHGGLLVFGSFEGSYDALIHIFFGAHYAEGWFDPWEPRWYTGFLTVAYPPFSHQAIALLSGLVGLKAAFVVAQLSALLLLTVGIYRFSAVIVPARSAGYAALAFALSSSLTETVHIFGQLPTTLSLAFLMNALPFVWRFLREGGRLSFLQAVAWLAATTGSHHVTTLFGGVFFIGPLVAIALFEAVRTERDGEATGETLWARLRRRLYRIAPALRRTVGFGVAAVTVLMVVVLPYWVWSSVDPILQVPIPHGSRENFLTRPSLGLFFWAIPWASSFAFLPYVILRGLRSWRWPLAVSILLLTLLGTGGTTPIPRMLLRGAFDILTLDRFTFWATMLILPFVGLAVDSLAHGDLRRALTTWGRAGRVLRGTLLAGVVAVHVGVALAVVAVPAIQPTQPAKIEVDPIVRFLEKDEHWRYRYLTLGFGDQMAWLAANTRATTPDGNYHSARRLPELTTVPVERLEGAKYTGVPGIGSLEQFLRTPERYHLKFVFSNDAFYDPILFFHGWHSLGRLENGIEVWERDDVPPLPERLPRRVWPLYQRLMWGLLPPLAVVAAFLSVLLPARRAPRQREPLPVEPGGGAPRISDRRLRLGLAIALAVDLGLVGLVATSWALQTPRLTGPEGAVVRYWDRIDLKDFERAWTYVAPVDGLDVDRWLLDLSVVGGLRSGYAKLEAIETRVVAESGDVPTAATVEATLAWFTSLGVREERVVHRVVRVGNDWRIRVAPRDEVRPPASFVAQPGLDIYRSPRRLSTTVTDRVDVLDRPELHVTEARLVAYRAVPSGEDGPAGDDGTPVSALPPDGSATRLALVGTVRNVDPRPADVTLTGILRDVAGRRVAETNAGSAMIHTLLPGEATSFRIDFDGVDAPLDPRLVMDADVVARAVVTSYGLERDVATWTRPANGAIETRFVNVGSVEATIPKALLALYGDDGLLWVREAYLDSSLVPYASSDLPIAADLPDGLRVLSEAVVHDSRRDPGTSEVREAGWTAPRFPMPPAAVAGSDDASAQGVPRSDLVPTAYLVQAHAFGRRP